MSTARSCGPEISTSGWHIDGGTIGQLQGERHRTGVDPSPLQQGCDYSRPRQELHRSTDLRKGGFACLAKWFKDVMKGQPRPTNKTPGSAITAAMALLTVLPMQPAETSRVTGGFQLCNHQTIKPPTRQHHNAPQRGQTTTNPHTHQAGHQDLTRAQTTHLGPCSHIVGLFGVFSLYYKGLSGD
jgi:hypothetical protein